MKGLVYKIYSPGRPEVYVGSTVESLERALRRHELHFQHWLHDRYHFVSSFYIFYQRLVNQPVYIEALHEGEFESFKDLRMLEREYIGKMPTVNLFKPIRKPSEKLDKCRRWRANNKQWLCTWYQNNKERIEAYDAEPIPCYICGKTIRRDGMRKHTIRKHSTSI
jgi:hypothetical protein